MAANVIALKPMQRFMHDPGRHRDAKKSGMACIRSKVRMQDHRQGGHKICSLHAPEVECIGKGNPE
jgi:hypothetical protein